MRGLWWIPALVLAAAVYAAFDGNSGIRTWLRLRGDLHAARGRIAAAQDEIARLERASRELDSDSFAIERAIREDLELAMPGEIIVRLSRDDRGNPRFP